MWMLLAGGAFACPERFNLIAETQELNELLGPKDEPGARENADAVLERMRARHANLACVIGYADPSRLVGLYTVGARAAARVGDAEARATFLRQIYLLSPEEPVSDVLRQELGDVDPAGMLPRRSRWARVRAANYLRVDGVPVRPGDSWLVPPGPHLVQWTVDEVSPDGKTTSRVVSEMQDLGEGERVRYDGGASARQADLRPAITIAGGGLVVGGAIAMGVGAVMIHDRATGEHPDGIDEKFNTEMDWVVWGGATAVGLGLSTISVSLAF